MMSLSFCFLSHRILRGGLLMYVWRMEKIMAENFREWKMLQQYEKYQKGRKAVQPKKEDLRIRHGVRSET